MSLNHPWCSVLVSLYRFTERIVLMFSQIKISCSWAYPLMLRTHFPLHVSDLVSNNSLLTVRVKAADPVADLGPGFQWDCFTATETLICFLFFHEIYHLSSFSSILSPFRDMKPQPGRKSGRDVKLSLQYFFFFWCAMASLPSASWFNT